MTVLIVAIVLIGLLLGARTLGGIIRTGCMGVLIGIVVLGALLYYLLHNAGTW
jgi:hypothetical protein